MEGPPSDAVEALRGRMWRKSLADEAELAGIRKSMQVVSTHLLGGATEARVYAEPDPADGFIPVEASLEDAYFLALSGRN